mmetsp:Transcript_12938/g.20474  ORF Transcript_12938/g.20474 Transcript_12938/m.20474 type:complete len:313 (-) Transcript_12938:194-1132(-)
MNSPASKLSLGSCGSEFLIIASIRRLRSSLLYMEIMDCTSCSGPEAESCATSASCAKPSSFASSRASILFLMSLKPPTPTKDALTSRATVPNSSMSLTLSLSVDSLQMLGSGLATMLKGPSCSNMDNRPPPCWICSLFFPSTSSPSRPEPCSSPKPSRTRISTSPVSALEPVPHVPRYTSSRASIPSRYCTPLPTLCSFPIANPTGFFCKAAGCAVCIITFLRFRMRFLPMVVGSGFFGRRRTVDRVGKASSLFFAWPENISDSCSRKASVWAMWASSSAKSIAYPLYSLHALHAPLDQNSTRRLAVRELQA